MRKAIIISLSFHAVVTILVFQWVAFREVRYIPREMYNVTLVTPAAAEAAPKTVAATPVPEPPEEKKKEEEMAAPPDLPKPKPPTPKKEEPRQVPSTEIRKTVGESSDSTQTAGEGSTPATGEMSFDSGDFPFAHYISRLRQKIAASWRAPAGQGLERTCRVYFRVHRDGSVSNVTVEQSSSVFLFDQSCQRAVLQAAPMPPLPREFAEQYLGVHFSFVYRESQ